MNRTILQDYGYYDFEIANAEIRQSKANGRDYIFIALRYEDAIVNDHIATELGSKFWGLKPSKSYSNLDLIPLIGQVRRLKVVPTDFRGKKFLIVDRQNG